MTSPKEAYRYALKNGGSDKLREICCETPKYAYCYARDVDSCSRKDTRTNACKDPEYAFWYARGVDRGYHEETRRACYRDPYLYTWYLGDLLKSKYYEELYLLPDIKRINHES